MGDLKEKILVEMVKMEGERKQWQVQLAVWNTERSELRKKIDNLESNQNDTSDWIVHGVSHLFYWPHIATILCQDTQALDRIRLRNLLDQAQTALAHASGLVTGDSTAMPSQQWQIGLDSEEGGDALRHICC
jgi:hypothetical protein